MGQAKQLKPLRPVKRRLKVGDMVYVIAGKDKGRKGAILKFVKEDRVLVEGVNLVYKHKKPNPQQNDRGGIIKKEAAVHISNVALLNPTTNKPDRVGYRRLETGKKVRVYKSTNEDVESDV